MTNDPWGPGPSYPPPSVPPPGPPTYSPGPPDRAPFQATGQRPAPPSLAPTIVVTVLASIFGVIPASLHASRARQWGYDGGRYWKAFGITLGGVLATQVLIVGGLLATGVLGANLFGLAGSPGSESSAVRPPVTSATPEQSQPAGPAGPAATEVSSSPTPSPRERTGREEPTRTPSSVSIVSESSGEPCSGTVELSDWGAYPLARCRTWKPSNGLLTGAPLATGSTAITCQADLQEQNPIFTAGQTNSWWVWTQADDGTWDWFPETAIAEGVSDQPINGIARCQ